MKSLCAIAVAASAAFGTLTTTAPAQTITDIVAASGGEFDGNRHDFDILLNAVLTAGLEGALADPAAGYTVFAPTDMAFVLLARDLGYEGKDEAGAWDFLVTALTDLGGGDPIPVLTDVLLYHVAPEEATALDVIFLSFLRQDIPTLQGATITPRFFKLIDQEPDLRDPFLIFWRLNIRADNGIIHPISRVLIPTDLP